MALSGGFLDEERGRLAQEAQGRQKRIATQQVQTKVVTNDHQLNSGATKDIPPPKDVDPNDWKDALDFLDDIDNIKPVRRRNRRLTKEKKVEAVSSPSKFVQGGFSSTNSQIPSGRNATGLDREVWDDIAYILDDSALTMPTSCKRETNIPGEERSHELNSSLAGTSELKVFGTSSTRPKSFEKSKPEDRFKPKPSSKSSLGIEYSALSSGPTAPGDTSKSGECFQPKPTAKSPLVINNGASNKRSTAPDNTAKLEEWLHPKPAAKTSLGIDYGAPSRSSAADNSSKLEERLHPKPAAKTSLAIDYGAPNRRSSAPDNTCKLEERLHPKPTGKTSLGIDYGATSRRSSAADNSSKLEDGLHPKPAAKTSLGIDYGAPSRRSSAADNSSKLEERLHPKPAAKTSLAIDYGAPNRRSSAPDNTCKLEERLHPKPTGKTSLGIDYGAPSRRSSAPDNTSKLEEWLYPKTAGKTSLGIDYGASNRALSAPDTHELEEWLYPKSAGKTSLGIDYGAPSRSSAPDNTSELEEWLYSKSTTKASQGRGDDGSNRKSSSPDNTTKLEEWLHPKPAAKSSLSIDYSADSSILGEKKDWDVHNGGEMDGFANEKQALLETPGQNRKAPWDIIDGEESSYAKEKAILMEKLAKLPRTAQDDNGEMDNYENQKQHVKPMMTEEAPSSLESQTQSNTDAQIDSTDAVQSQPNGVLQKPTAPWDVKDSEKYSYANKKAVLMEDSPVKATKAPLDTLGGSEIVSDAHNKQNITEIMKAEAPESTKSQSGSKMDNVRLSETEEMPYQRKSLNQLLEEMLLEMPDEEESSSADDKALIKEKFPVTSNNTARDFQEDGERESNVDVAFNEMEEGQPLHKGVAQKPKAVRGIRKSAKAPNSRSKGKLRKKLAVGAVEAVLDVQHDRKIESWKHDQEKPMEMKTVQVSKSAKSKNVPDIDATFTETEAGPPLPKHKAQKPKYALGTNVSKRSSYVKDKTRFMEKRAAKDDKVPRNLQNDEDNDNHTLEQQKFTEIINAEASDITITKRRNKNNQTNLDHKALPSQSEAACNTDVPFKATKTRKSQSDRLEQKPQMSAKDLSLDDLLGLVKAKFKEEKEIHFGTLTETVGGTSRQLTKDEQFVDISSVDTETVEGDTPAARRAREWIRKKYNVGGKYQPAEEETPVHDHHDLPTSARRSRRQDERRCLNKTRHRHRSTSGKLAPPRSTPEREQRQRLDFADISQEIQPSKSVMVRLRSGMRRLGSRFVSIFTSCSCGSARN